MPELRCLWHCECRYSLFLHPSADQIWEDKPPTQTGIWPPCRGNCVIRPQRSAASVGALYTALAARPRAMQRFSTSDLTIRAFRAMLKGRWLIWPSRYREHHIHELGSPFSGRSRSNIGPPSMPSSRTNSQSHSLNWTGCHLPHLFSPSKLASAQV